MAAYAAVISLKKTIHHILESSRISLVPPSPEIVQLAYRELETFQEVLERLDSSHVSKSRKKVNALDARIKEAVWKFEDLLESLLSHQILSQGERDPFLFSVDLEGLQHDVDSFIASLKDMEKEYIYELHNMPDVEEDELGLSGIDFGGIRSEMVGLCDEFEYVSNWLMQNYKSNYPLIGMAGIGKTTLAKKIFEDPVISRWFDHRAWVTVGRKSQFNQVSQAILAQVAEEEDCKIGENSKLKERLEGKRCLIVLDDVWDKQVLDYLATFLPKKNGEKIKILITTRLRSVARHEDFCEIQKPIRRLNVEESKELLREKVFGEEVFPPQLEKAVEKITENCEGLPLMIVKVADRLSKARNNEPEYWDEVAKKRSSVFMDAYDEISKVLFPTYDCLPQHVKTICSYLGAFPQDYEIPVSKLINLLTAERFIDQVQNLKSFVARILRDILAATWTTTSSGFIKTCKVYSCWWYLFKTEASKNKFLLVLNSGFDDLEEEGIIKGQRRLSLHSNFVFSFKEVYDSVKCDCASTTRSLLCFGPYHPYSMPLDVGFKLLRVLDALKVRFYNFPIEILELVLLQYLALTYNGELPTSISKLFNLKFLIIHPHMTIKSSGASSYVSVPVQIWDMQELKHVEILGSCLPNPTCATSLHELSTLVGVNASSCTEEVLKKLPNITKLGIQIELTPYIDDSNPLISCFNHISELENLKTLKCSVTNPWFAAAPLTPLPMFSSTLQQLHLSGLGYPWKYMEVIGSLPNLEVLELRCYAFRGPKWETETKSFLHLNYLIIEDTDLVQWKSRRGSFPVLYCIKFKHCYKLEELHWPSVKSGTIELVDCNPLAVTCAKKLETRKENFWVGKTHVSVTARSSFYDGELK